MTHTNCTSTQASAGLTAELQEQGSVQENMLDDEPRIAWQDTSWVTSDDGQSESKKCILRYPDGTFIYAMMESIQGGEPSFDSIGEPRSTLADALADTHGKVEHATHNRYALAVQDAEAGLIWSVGGVWSASLLSQSPALMTGPEVDAFHKKHPNAHIVDVIVYREACEAYNAGFDSVLDHNERSTPESRQAARKAGIESLVRAGFPENALEIGKIDYLQQGNVPNSHDQAALADQAFADYDFGEGVTVTDTGNWEYLDPGHERSRKVYVETEREDDGPAPRWTLNFNVRFNEADGSLAEAYALDQAGQPWGRMPEQVPRGKVPERAKEAAKRELQEALQKATESGLLDDLANDVHPDAINQFCDAVGALYPPKKAQDIFLSPGM
ncbi:hypothetical protein P245_20975 [Comamonas thiooxydans]|uniref:Uncharacterized protein n=1 Tax=Comamonas thiooxydans TaxID=363952 RepID=A0A0E3BG33_9BURK|nr:hypothetical protein [Comamonas thiooxydans]KGG86194.1 hypothetical protein P245_20975 [Comamonas thiooxydans]